MAAPAATLLPPPAHQIAEQVVEDIRHRRCEFGSETLRVAGAATALERRMTKLIVGRALGRVFQHFVGFGQFLELLLGSLVAGIGIGMVLLGELAKRALELGFGRATLKPENLVIVTFGHGRLSFHASSYCCRAL